MSDNEITLKASISSTPNLNGNIVTGQTKVSTNDHNLLINRDLPNQHPIEAIEGLKEELLSIKEDSTTTNLSIKKLETKIQNKIRTVKAVPINMSVGDYIFLEKESE
jgi:hypothetical protein